MNVRSLREAAALISNTCPKVSSGKQVPPCRVTSFRTGHESHRLRSVLLGGVRKRWISSDAKDKAPSLSDQFLWGKVVVERAKREI